MDRATIRKNDIPRLKSEGRFLAPGRNPGDPTAFVELVESPEAALAALPGRVLAVPDALHVLPMG